MLHQNQLNQRNWKLFALINGDMLWLVAVPSLPSFAGEAVIDKTASQRSAELITTVSIVVLTMFADHKPDQAVRAC